MSEILEKLFGSSSRVKVIRFFLLNQKEILNLREISRKCKIGNNVAKREISFLKGIGFLKNKSEIITNLIKLKNGKTQGKKKKIEGLGLNELFPLLNPLKGLIVDAVSINKEKIIKSLKSAGNIKLIIFSGIFTETEGSGTDILVVGDGIKKALLENVLKKTEVEIGKDIIYGFFDTKEFLYRFGMNDRFIREILDSPHEKAVNKLGI
ncbi:MAG: hypothetical protein WC587_02545 [Candidatus Paceibacterota bacterium]